MSFKNIIGQGEISRKLVELVQHNRLSHALLFLGNEGSGALPLALAFAQYTVCEKVNRPQTAAAPAGPSLFGEEPAVASVPAELPVGLPVGLPADACGICPACVKAAQLIHPDIHFSYPVIPRKS